MTITVTDQNGVVHTFANGTTREEIMSAIQRSTSASRNPPQPTPLPPGATPGGLNPRPGVNSSMIPLSGQAETAIRMLPFAGVTGNRALVGALENMLKHDPNALAQRTQAEAAGKSADKIAQSKGAGAQMLKTYAVLRDHFDKTPDDLLKQVISTWNTRPYSSYIPVVGGMTYPEAKNTYLPWADGKAWAAQNRFQHLNDALENAFISNSQGLNMSNERQKAFKNAITKYMDQPNRKASEDILDDMIAMISADFNLSPEEANEAIRTGLLEEKKRAADLLERKKDPTLKQPAPPAPGDKPLATQSGGTSAVPPREAIRELQANANDPFYMEKFNEKYNGGNPGLAEAIVSNAAGRAAGALEPVTGPTETIMAPKFGPITIPSQSAPPAAPMPPPQRSGSVMPSPSQGITAEMFSPRAAAELAPPASLAAQPDSNVSHNLVRQYMGLPPI